ncbi:RidA family protein [Actinobacteria bacterium YIM 96077]|uniref:RidA family protein n=1 Tax=Phytoactinopolyspora halophila TaxID=1981511 RepID=A0A329QYW0_9ACTN|nr:Rid family hydrolase [Phytoactinopolyspora halophila]AYY13258.1 RidA family protein [Actinobacteria bacterium YIM 96077]RAW17505.1 RidA family protein [Phytoactinopolyspora halophila]
MAEFIISDDLPTPGGPYSHVAVAGSTVWTAGFGPIDPQTGEVPEGIVAQTELTIDNVERALRAAGLGLQDVVKVTAHLQHLHEHFAQFNDVYGRRFTGSRPVRTTVGSDLMNILVEIDVVAVSS